MKQSVQSERKPLLNFQLSETQFKEDSTTKSPGKPTCCNRIPFLSTFLKSSFNSLSDNLKKTLQNWVQSERKALSNFQLSETQYKEQSATKSPVKPTCDNWIPFLSTFLKSSFNSLSDNLKKTLQNFVQSGRKAVSKFELTETQFEKTVSGKIVC